MSTACHPTSMGLHYKCQFMIFYNLFAETERITPLYTKAGTDTDAIQDKCIKAAVIQNLPDRTITNLAIRLQNADSVEEMQSIITIYLHDHKTGLPRDQGGPLICLAEDEPPTCAAVAAAQPPEQPMETQDLAPHAAAGGDLDAVKGGKQSSGKGKGCGQCWHYGQMEQPRRECPEWLKLRNGAGNVAALKGGRGTTTRAKARRAKARKVEKEKGGQITGSPQANQLERVSTTGATTNTTMHGAGRTTQNYVPTVATTVLTTTSAI